jgi:Flp pilus assembly pilin Flp
MIIERILGIMNRRSKGSSLIENGILLGLVTIASIGIWTTFGGTINTMFTKSSQQIHGFQPFGVPADASVDPDADPISESDGNEEDTPFNDVFNIGDNDLTNDITNIVINDFGNTDPGGGSCSTVGCIDDAGSPASGSSSNTNSTE